MRGGCGELSVEGEDQHRIGPGGFEQFLPLIERGQAERRRIGREMADRVRIKGGDNRRAVFGPGPSDGFTDHGLMAPVKPVKIAQGDNPPAQAIGNRAARIKPRDGHPAKLIGRIPARIRRSAFPPITARISSTVKPSSISAWVIWTSCDVSNRTVVPPS